MKILSTAKRAGLIPCLLVCLGAVALADDDLVVQDQSHHTLKTYTIEQLRSQFAQAELDTPTPWTKRGSTLRYRGPALLDVLAQSGLRQIASVEVNASDGFAANIKIDEIERYSPILALEVACSSSEVAQSECAAPGDYRPLRAEEYGPLFLLWPLNRMPASYSPQRNSLWVWFVKGLRADR